ncbi:hypothetical protein ACRQ5D_11735 [Mucilaginibacter sp. P25]|uniref:hypothetical protein n=1 Tax=Mucilaginibacter sp. P25 TaxID=3423945 RepID=UPI003D7BB2A7
MLKKLFLYYLLVSPLLCLAQTKITDRVNNISGKYEPSIDQVAIKEPGLSNVINKLKEYKVSYIAEKVYLHFDKPYYAAGDTVYFKAYITAGDRHELSDISGVLHVELVNATNRVDRSVKLQITDGVAWGISPCQILYLRAIITSVHILNGCKIGAVTTILTGKLRLGRSVIK